MPERSIHIAGFPVRVGNKVRQRCAWCEEILVDEDLSLLASPDPDWKFHFWQQGDLIEVVRGGGRTQTSIVPHVDGAQLPARACAAPPVKLEVVRG